MGLYGALRPLLFRASADTAHDMAVRLGRVGQVAGPLVRALHPLRLGAEERARLSSRVLGLDFRVPIGTAAGLDKNAEIVPLVEQIGCGFCEVGSVSAEPRPGNPKPRAFRLPTDRALVNRLGLGNEGAAAIARRIGGMRRPPGFPIGINVVKTHDPAIIGAEGLDDFACAARTMLPHADFLVLNVSCPNTAEGKTFEDPASLAELLDRVMAERAALRSGVPVLVKLSPPAPLDAEGAFDTSALDELMDLALERGVAGFVATNTASDRAGLSTPAARLEAIGRTMEFLKAVLDSEGEGSLGLPHWLVVSDLLPVKLSLSVKLGFRFLKQVVKGHRGNAEDLATHLEFLASQLDQPFKA